MSTWTTCVVTLLAAALVGTAEAKEGTATVRAIRGTADYSTGGGTWQKLSVGKVLGMGSTIRTAADSEVDLFLKQNGPVVRVTPESTLGLDTLLFEETGDETVITTKLDLKNGRILGNVKKLAAASKYEVQIPSGVVGIRGTDYDISADGLVRIIQGLAIVFYTEGGNPMQTQVSEGMAFNAQNKQVTPIPQQVINQIQQVIQQLQQIVLQLQGPIQITPQPNTTVPSGTTGDTGNGGTSGGGGKG